VRQAGVEPPRLATGQLSVHPDWEVAQGQQRPAGYRAAAGLTARLEVPARAGRVASAAVVARPGWPSRGRCWMPRSLSPGRLTRNKLLRKA
jgi:hypothetical protein